MASKPNPIDVHVGKRLRLRRTLLGMSQERLGELLGLTFQQVQKYERGVNRIGSSRLFELGQILEHVDVTSDVHGQHDQGGWSQARFQRGIEHEVLLHMKDVSDILLRLHEDQPLDCLVVAGPTAEAAEFVRLLHP